MSNSLTTVAILDWKEEKDVLDDTSQSASAWKSVLYQIKALPGVLSVVWGPQVEDLKRIMLVVDWENFDTNANTSASIKTHLHEALTCHLPTTPIIFTVKLDYDQIPASSVHKKTSSAVTEIVFHYFETPITRERRAQVAADAASFSQRLYSEMPRMESSSTGWQLEDEKGVPHHSIPDGEATMFIKFLGWPSIEEHMKARETQAFKNQVANLKLGARGGEMKHVKFVKEAIEN